MADEVLPLCGYCEEEMPGDRYLWNEQEFCSPECSREAETDKLRADLDAAKARIAELEGALREEIEDLEELAVVNENGWSARDRSNRFNDGAAVIQREMAAKLRALLTTPSSTGERRE